MLSKNFPPDQSSINDYLVWVFYDANAIDPLNVNYKYVGEVWIGGTKVHTERTVPRPDTGFGIFDFSAIIRSYVNAIFNPAAGIAAQEFGVGQFRTADVEIKIREEYNGTVSAVVFTDSARTFYNHYNERFDSLTALSTYNNKPLSARGNTIDLLFTSARYYLPYYATTTTPFDVVIAGYTKTITPTVANSLQLINISPGAVNTDSPGAITTATTSYTVLIGGITYTVNIVCKGLYTNYLLHFLNKYGGFESMLFNKPRRRTVDVEKKEFKQLGYRIDSTTGVMTIANGDISHEQKTVFSVKNNEKLKVQTDLLSDADYNWMAQLINSPMVMLEDNGKLYPVSVAANNYEYKEYMVDRLTTLSIDVEFPSKNAQYR